MIQAEQIQEILSVYKKHGWNLRRVLLSDALRAAVNDRLQELFGGTEIVSSPLLNAMWFSRVSGVSGEAWELRHLSTTPFALIEVFETDDESVREERRKDLENLLDDKIKNR